MENRRSKVRASFVVETLTYLARGGRCKPVTALLGNTLKLKPQIVVERGSMGVSRKYRGKQSSVILKYVKDLEDALLHADPTCVFITHSGRCHGRLTQWDAQRQETDTRFPASALINLLAQLGHYLVDDFAVGFSF